MRVIDPKYHIEDEQIIKTSNGESVPDDEPMILFRASDRLALAMLHIYRVLNQIDGCSDHQINEVNAMLYRFLDFSVKHPERMKQPGCTEGK